VALTATVKYYLTSKPSGYTPKFMPLIIKMFTRKGQTYEGTHIITLVQTKGADKELMSVSLVTKIKTEFVARR
jgi:hypothetical protein